jgi:hypothetical protein
MGWQAWQVVRYERRQGVEALFFTRIGRIIKGVVAGFGSGRKVGLHPNGERRACRGPRVWVGRSPQFGERTSGRIAHFYFGLWLCRCAPNRWRGAWAVKITERLQRKRLGAQVGLAVVEMIKCIGSSLAGTVIYEVDGGRSQHNSRNRWPRGHGTRH